MGSENGAYLSSKVQINSNQNGHTQVRENGQARSQTETTNETKTNNTDGVGLGREPGEEFLNLEVAGLQD